MTHSAFNNEIISTQSIKPSTPTPAHLKHRPLSRLDQLVGFLEYRTPLVQFYAAAPNNHLHRLNHSLATTLSLFYPFAGRLSEDLTTIICNDEGVPFIVGHTKATLSTILSDPNRVELIPEFLPPKQVIRSFGRVPLVIKLTLLRCGGIAIGSQVLHKVSIDGITRDHFFKTWAAINAGRYNDVIPPDLSVALSLFPPCHGPGPMTGGDIEPKVLGPVDHGSGNEGGSCIVKPFYFSPRSIRALQSMARSESVPNPTRVETVSGFLWKHLVAAASPTFLEKDQSERNESVLIHSVNMRPHIHPPAPSQAFGKFTTHAIVQGDNIGNASIVELASMIRKALTDTKDIKFVSKFIGEQGEEAARQHGQKTAKLKHDPNKMTYHMASWSGVDSNFGFGKPVWVGFMGGKVSRWFRNFVPLIHIPGQGIEAWLVLDEQEMANLESDLEFLAYASCSGPIIYSPNSSL